MEKQNQVCSLEYAKKLKKLGVPQDSLWVWNIQGTLEYKHKEWVEYTTDISAYTVAELGEMLPEMYFVFKNDENDWFGAIIKDRAISELATEKLEIEIITQASTMANAMAKMLIYLLENKLIELNK